MLFRRVVLWGRGEGVLMMCFGAGCWLFLEGGGEGLPSVGFVRWCSFCQFVGLFLFSDYILCHVCVLVLFM